MQNEPFSLDRRSMLGDACGDVDLKARTRGGARHRQAMGDEIPVFGDEIDDPGWHRVH